MARLPYANPEALPPEFQGMGKRNISRAILNSPRAAYFSIGLGSYLRNESRLDPRLRELAIIQIGYLHRSPYDYTSHVRTALKLGVPEDDIRAVGAETAGRISKLEPLARAVLRTAREMDVGLRVSDETFAVLKAAFDAEVLTDLLILISTYCGIARLIPALELELEEDLKPFLDRFPFD